MSAVRTNRPDARAAIIHAAITRAHGTGLSAMRRNAPDQTFDHVRTDRIQTADLGESHEPDETKIYYLIYDRR
jgi:hypothetical protein